MAACDQGPARQQSPARSAAARPARAGGHADWPAYHANSRRSGYVAGLPAAGRLPLAWSQRLDGAVYGQPLVIGRTVIAATEQDTIYGLSLSTGRVRWSAHVASPLPLVRAAVRRHQPARHHEHAGLLPRACLRTGPERPLGACAGRHRSGDRPGAVPRASPLAGQAALLRPAALCPRGGSGRIYVAFGGHFGDCGPYVGSVVGDASGRTGCGGAGRPSPTRCPARTMPGSGRGRPGHRTRRDALRRRRQRCAGRPMTTLTR